MTKASLLTAGLSKAGNRGWLVPIFGSLGAVVGLLALLVLALLALADSGHLDGIIARRASARLGRPIHFGSLRTHLLSRSPSITVHGLVIGNSASIGGNMAEVQSITAQLELLPLLRGAILPRAIVMQGLALHLIRFGPGNNNWTLTKAPKPGPAFAPLRDVGVFSISGGTIDLKDYGRSLLLRGNFSHDSRSLRAFRLVAGGMLKGFPISLDAEGGPLNGAGVGPPWPFSATLVDAETRVQARGKSEQPFDLSVFDIALKADGPNLADLGYLFNLLTPNSARFHLTAHAKTDGTHFAFENINGRIGDSDITASIKADHGTSRRRIVASLRSRHLTKADIDAALSPIPPHAEARRFTEPHASPASGRWMLSDAPFGVARMKAADLDLTVKAGTLTGYPLPLRTVDTRILLDHGRLQFKRFSADLYGGRLTGESQLDVGAATPKLHIRGALAGGHLAGIMPGQPGTIDLAFDLHGQGSSLHAAAATAAGNASMGINNARLPRRAAWILGGDLLRAIGASGSKGSDLPLDCSFAHFEGTSGRLALSRLAIATQFGDATGSGFVDLGTETLEVFIKGRPNHRRLFQVATPLLVSGSLQSPKVTLLPGRVARKLGLRGPIGLALTPLTGLLAPPKPLAVSSGCPAASK